MRAHLDHPLVVFVVALIVQAVAVFAGDLLRRRSHQLRQDQHHDFNTVQATTMTLLALIIGFTFSMAVSRYDQRKTFEEAEANAIGTEYLRAGLLLDDLGAQAKQLLRNYLRLRIAFYDDAGRIGVAFDQDTANAQMQRRPREDQAGVQVGRGEGMRP